ncbi:hypothetical protein B0A81_18665 [Flavobacterium plurextorum]|uniref:Gliding motility-associated C-terminal domain-containing protein n=1 Tax=Flavobacterium plurextorum TaxID=1114867 RepID=A0ABX4CR75_9FLAO|nr:gliding motility-associated C-terminal domain-containing protein [Flavobacterium plurextorum]OXB03354.1 hypothetical protein B0A81_18665 [Flavobacterium plurextorum]
MKNISSHLFLFLLLLFVQANYAQTVNLGDLYVSAGTILSTVAPMDNKSTAKLVNDGDFYLYDHYNNDGTVTFTAGLKSGSTHMIGTFGFQNISGNTAMSWYDAEFGNSIVQPAFYLSNELRIFGVSNFDKGIIDNISNKGKLFFMEGAQAVNASDDSFVNGSVQKDGRSDFYFPIGAQGQYRHSAISFLNNSENVFASRYFFENSNLLYPHVNKQKEISLIDDKEYWIVEKENQESGALITLTWDEDTTPASIYAAPLDELHIIRWDASKKIWVDEGGAADSSTKEITTVVQASDYGIFTLARFSSIAEDFCGTITVFNAVSPNGDNKNDYFKISGLTECASENTIEIYNRWGVKVYETSNYGSNDNFFKGYSEGRTTISKNELLPAGTYFYILYLKDQSKVKIKQKTGYLYLSW